MFNKWQRIGRKAYVREYEETYVLYGQIYHCTAYIFVWRSTIFRKVHKSRLPLFVMEGFLN